ncbi:MAG: hypothetical protein IJY85_10975 [Ruminococcus sp.]|nr:hypothetical protein [Ruminococcus sp.]
MYAKWKRVLAGLIAAISIFSLSAAMPVSSEGEDAATDSAASSEDKDEGATEELDYVMRTEQEVLDKMMVAAENDKLVFYCWNYDNVSDENPVEDIFAVKNKENGYIWWSSPINAGGDAGATPILRKELASALVLTYGEPQERSTTNVRSGDSSKCKISAKTISDGVQVTYNFSRAGIKIPVKYVLRDDYLEVSIETADITEKDTSDGGKVVTALTLCNAFGAGSSEDEGYYVIPDGSGALINFNNGKISAKNYAQKVYGTDITAVPNSKGAVTEGVPLPMYGIVRDNNGMMVVVEEGDGNAILNTAVSGQSKSSYNLCNFQYVLRGTDTYYMGGEVNALTVFESGEMKTDELKMRFYPVSDTENEVDYVDIAAKYRDYLLADYGVEKVAKADQAQVYVDVYQGVEKPTSILGVPVTLKTSMTSFEQTQEIVEGLKSRGIDDMVVSLNNWTNAGIANKVDFKAKGASVLGGNGDFKDLVEYFNQNNIAYYPVVNNKTFVNGNGYMTFFDTAMRVSGSYSRLYTYERAFGTPDSSKDNQSLLSPAAFPEIYEKLTKNYKDAGLTGVSLGDMTWQLYGDYGKEKIGREDAMDILTESYAQIETGVGSMLAQYANAYALPYVDHVTNAPLSSSSFDLFDEDIPFYQLVLHGVIPYSTQAINGSADSDRLFLLALATGSNLHYDMVYEEISELKDTEFDVYYYAHYAYWLDTAAQEHKLASEILSGVSDQTITGYEREGDVITTTYENGTVTVINLDTGEIRLNDTVYRLSDYVTEGGLIPDGE